MRTKCVYTAVLSLFVCLTFLAAAPVPNAEPRYIAHGGAVGGEYIVALAETHTPEQVAAIRDALVRDYGVAVLRTFTTALNALHCRTTADVAKKLAADPRVTFVEENFAVQASSTLDRVTSDHVPAATWTLHRISHRTPLPANNSEYRYPHLKHGEGVIAYVLDTGVRASHDQFMQGGSSRVLSGYDTYHPATETDLDGDPTFAGNPCPPQPGTNTTVDEDHCAPGTACLGGGHGTAAASILGGNTLGVAPNVTIIPVRTHACDGRSTLDRVLHGFEWVARDLPSRKSAASFRGAVINMSFEGVTASEAEVGNFKAALARVNAMGAVAFVAAGNFPAESDGTVPSPDSCGRYPAAYAYGNGDDTGPHVITVSGINRNNEREDCGEENFERCGGTAFGFGGCVDLFAPGTEVVAAGIRDESNGNVESDSAIRQHGRAGTSWATPHASGAAARLLAEYPIYAERGPEGVSDEIWRRLRDTATRGVVQNGGAGSPDRLLYIGAVRITQQPQSVVVKNESGTVDLSVAAEPSGGVLSYQWFSGHYNAAQPIAGANGSTYAAPKNVAQSYWVRVTETIGGETRTADSLIATVTACNDAATRPAIQSSPLPNGWTRLSVALSGTRFDWYLGSPGDVSRLVHTSTTGTYDVRPASTTDYWVRVSHANSCPVDSSNSVTVSVCNPPVITLQPRDDIASNAVTLTVRASGTNLVYQWFEVVNGIEKLLANQTRRELVVRPPAGAQENDIRYFYAQVTSLCGFANGSYPTQLSNVAEVVFSNCDLTLPQIIHPNTGQLAGLHTLGQLQVDVNVPRGRGVAITARAMRQGGTPKPSAQVTWLDNGRVHGGKSYYAEHVTTRRKLTADTTDGCSRRAGDVYVRECGEPLVIEQPTVGAGTPARLRVRSDAAEVTVQWYLGVHDDDPDKRAGAPQSPGPDGLSTFTPPQNSSFWARVTARCETGGFTTEDTPVFTNTVCETVTMRHPALQQNVTLGLTPTTITVPEGRAVALTGVSAGSVRWHDGPGLQPYRNYYVQNVDTQRQINVESPFGCVTGVVSVRPATGVGCTTPIIDAFPVAPGPIPLGTTTTLSVGIAADYPGAVVEWYEGAHDDRGPRVSSQWDAATRTSRITASPNKTYWVRAIVPSCGGTAVVEDSPLVAVSCSNCVVRAVRGGAIRVNGVPKTFHIKKAGDTVTLSAPYEPQPNQTFEWRRDPSYDINEQPFQYGPSVSGAGAGTYWVRTITDKPGTEDDTVSDSYVTTIVNEGQYSTAVARIALDVDPPSHFIPAQGLARLKPDMPANACNVTYRWYQGADPTDPYRREADDADDDPSRLDLVNLPDTATFWLEAEWYETNADGTCGTTKRIGMSDPVEITVTCDPPAQIHVSTQPFDTRLARDEMIAISAWGLGKMVTYMWYTDSTLTRPFAIGPAQYKSFREDATLWIQGIDACGNTDVVDLRFYVCKPKVKTEPADLVINNTQTKQLTAVVDAAQSHQTLSYQWYRASATEPWAPVTGATTNSINVSGSATASYYCSITAPCDNDTEISVNTRIAKVEVCAKPTIAWTSYDQNVRRTELQTLHVEATGKDLTYQWYRGASGVTTDPIAGATGDSYALYVQDTTTFWVRVFSQGECSTDSASFTLTVSSAPEVSAVTATPATVVSGGTAALSVTATATSSAPLSYTWLKASEAGYLQVCGNGPACVTEAITAPTTYIVRVTSGTMISTESAPVTIGVCTFPPALPAAPDVQVSAGTPATLTLPISPADGNVITWYRGASGDTANPVALAGPSHQLYVNVTTTTQYWARVERDGCVSASGTSTVRVCVPTITTQPVAGSIVAGGSHTMTFVTGGTDAAQTYQWYAGNAGNTASPIAGATSASLTVSPAATTTYWCRATSSCGRTVDSNSTVVNVCTRPVINSVSNASIAPGQSANVHVNATGSNLTYQWYRGASGNTANAIAGATALTLTQSPSATTQYWCRVTSNGNCWSDSPVATIDVCTPATITTEPADKTVLSGQTATLSVTASGASGYQWYRGDGSVISGATSATYTTPALTADATYFVRVLNGVCATQSRTATVRACTLGASISGAQIGRGQSATLTAGVSGARSQELYYTWYTGASGNTATVWTAGPGLSSIMVSPNSTTSYWVRVNDGTCTTDSNTAIVEVCKPAITTHPSPVSINSGASATLAVAADISPVSVQWYAGAKGNTSSPVGGGTAASLVVSPSSSTTYWARVTGSCGTADSNAALVCVRPVITNTQGASIAPGSATTINVTATGASLSYQWYVGATGVTTNPVGSWNYPHLNVNPTTTTNYWVRVTSSGACSTDSPTITVNVCSNPTITTQPAGAAMYPGYTTATLSVTASPATAYQWYRGASGDTSAPVSGATSSTFNPGALAADTTYWVRVSNGLCATNSAAATVVVCRLSSSVNSAQTAVGQSTTLTVSVSNARSQSLYYTWYVGNSGNTAQVLTAGPTQSSVTVSPSTTTNYWVRVDDETCTSYSNTATVNVCIPRITTQPVGGVIAAGQSRTLTVASDLPGATYQWYAGNTGSGTAIAGATGASYVASPSGTTNYWVRVTGSCGVSVGSNTATVQVCAAPTANASPSLYNIAAGQSANVGVHATGANLTYQWFIGASGNTASPISGATASSLVVSPGSTTQYWCRVTSSGACTTNSGTITVDVCSPPTITSQPANATIVYAYNATLSVGATSQSGGTLTYQWYRGSSGDFSNPIAGATGSSFNTGALYADAQYWVTVTRGACVVGSATAYVTVCSMSAGIADVMVAANQTATLTAALSGARTGSPYYTWYMGATGNTSTPVSSGYNQSSIIVNRPSTTQYWVRVTDGGCTADSNTARYNVCIPTITSQPSNVTIASGTSTTLTVGTTGSGLTYQWYQGPVNTYSAPVGTNSPSLTVSPSSTTQYWVRILGCGGTAASSATVTVTVCVAPWVSEPISDPPVNPGSLIGVRVNTSGTGPLSYQWYRGQSGNTQYPVGTSSASYVFNAYSSEYYWVRVTSACGSVNSPAKLVSVNPSITQQPQSVSVSSGSRATFTVAADGTYLSYQWYTGNGAPIAGATSATYTTPPLTYEQTYFVYVSSGSAIRASNYVTASICDGPGVSFSSQYAGGNCQTLYVQPWNYGAYELAYDWYEGQPGDVSKPLGRGSYYRTVCPNVRTTYWVRVWTPDMTCYSDTGGITVN